MNDPKKSIKSKNPFKESSSQINNKNIATKKQNKLKLEIKKKNAMRKQKKE